MGDVVNLATPVSEGLRNIADRIDEDCFDSSDATVVLGSGEIFHLGPVSDERAAVDAVFNLNLGIFKLMNAGIGQ